MSIIKKFKMTETPPPSCQFSGVGGGRYPMLSRVLLGGYGGHSEPGKTRLDPNADTSSSYYPHGRFLSIRLSVVPISIDGTIKRTETLCRVGFPSVARLIRAHSVDPYSI